EPRIHECLPVALARCSVWSSPLPYGCRDLCKGAVPRHGLLVNHTAVGDIEHPVRPRSKIEAQHLAAAIRPEREPALAGVLGHLVPAPALLDRLPAPNDYVPQVVAEVALPPVVRFHEPHV